MSGCAIQLTSWTDERQTSALKKRVPNRRTAGLGRSEERNTGSAQKAVWGREISVHTVENITRRIYEKLGINKSSELSAWYFCECHQVDEGLSPIRKAKNTIYSILFLLILIPHTFDFDQDILRPQRLRPTRIERVIRTRKKD